MQARVQWNPPTGALGRLTERARARAATLGDRLPQGTGSVVREPAGPSFGEAFRIGTVAVIAEVKRRSPSKGAFDDSIDAVQRARLYEVGGARALSILTEPSEFGGSLDDLESVRKVSTLPLLRKDFHVHPAQIFEARAHGASAALLIMRSLGPDDTRIMADAAREAGIDAVFEVRDEIELGWATDAGAMFIGVNRRNLETLEMEDEVVEHLLPLIPRDAIAIAESGVSTREAVEAVAALGADAVLVGSALSVAADPRGAVASLTGVPRSGARG
ncbi:MAG TPA: indole-3-glycerol-phosphate synthase [Gemmatimonadaceae bacterium]